MHFKDQELESERGTTHSPSPMGNSEFCFPLTLNVLLASENMVKRTSVYLAALGTFI